MPAVNLTEMRTRYARFQEGGGTPAQFFGVIMHEVGMCDENGQRYLRRDSGAQKVLEGYSANVPTIAEKPRRQPEDFRWDVLAEAMIGPDWKLHIGLQRESGSNIVTDFEQRFGRLRMFSEEATAASTGGPSVWANVAAWSATVGGLMQVKFLQGYNSAAYDMADMYPIGPPPVFWQGGERFVDIIGPYKPAPEVGPGIEYPDQSMSALWVEPGPMKKYAGKISMAKETAAIDISGGQMLAKMKTAGDSLKYRENELALDITTGQTNNFRLGMLTDTAATAYQTYGFTITSPQGISRTVPNDIVNPFNDPGAMQISDEQLANLYHPVTDQPMEVELPVALFPTPLARWAGAINDIDEWTVATQSAAGPAQAAPGTFPNSFGKTRNPWKGLVAAKVSRRLHDRHIRATANADPNMSAGLGLTGAAVYRWYRLNPAQFACKRQMWPATTIDISPADWVMAVQGLVAAQAFDIAVMMQVLNPWAIQRNRSS
ncbi:MAG TPA: hypothetical protein VGE74_28200 [Gemmata sp.]